MNPTTRSALSMVLAVIATGPACAQDDPYAAENLPQFDYPLERDPSGYFPQRPDDWPSPALGDGPFDLQSWEQRDYRAVVVARGFTQPRGCQQHQ